MSAGGLTVLYPEWTFKGTAVRNHSALRTAPGQNVGCIEQAGWAVKKNTGFLRTPCGSLCPMMWCSIADRDQRALVLQWDVRCAETHLAHLTATLMSMRCTSLLLPVPDNLRSIQLQEERITGHMPPYKSKCIGILYGTRAIWPHLVVIPVHDGVESLTQISHLEVSHWVDYFSGENITSATSRGRKTYHVMADDMTHAPARRYTFFREHVMGFAPPNALIREVAGIDDHAEDVMGNVLVIKHEWKNKDKVVDCTTNDIEDVNNVIKRAIGETKFWT
ncbi:uncharacterized protein EDB91DRAFT_1296966 [Suillus paluster]|uniref:uncharacterized protein n=1 Tax=Suillus paluster TaxID=48578 RepID=UPI001B883011|nr:uncharacterized protein EDB91DRAFT_1296966 [Suillus paluster]KAG1734447.1 hypothetical protein EDB91DRAFT_1296966 [Suillus paluster]